MVHNYTSLRKATLAVFGLHLVCFVVDSSRKKVVWLKKIRMFNKKSCRNVAQEDLRVCDR